jgi:hypothetical protein
VITFLFGKKRYISLRRDRISFECKWGDLRLNDAERVLRELMGKSGFVNWNNGERKEYFNIVARKIKCRDQLKKRVFFVIDLDDLTGAHGDDVAFHHLQNPKV